MISKIFITAVVCLSIYVLDARAQSGRQPPKAPVAQPTITVKSPVDDPELSPRPYVPGKVESLVVGAEIVHNFSYFNSSYLDVFLKEFTRWMKDDPRPFMNLNKGSKMKLEHA